MCNGNKWQQATTPSETSNCINCFNCINCSHFNTLNFGFLPFLALSYAGQQPAMLLALPITVHRVGLPESQRREHLRLKHAPRDPKECLLLAEKWSWWIDMYIYVQLWRNMPKQFAQTSCVVWILSRKPSNHTSFGLRLGTKCPAKPCSNGNADTGCQTLCQFARRPPSSNCNLPGMDRSWNADPEHKPHWQSPRWISTNWTALSKSFCECRLTSCKATTKQETKTPQLEAWNTEHSKVARTFYDIVHARVMTYLAATAACCSMHNHVGPQAVVDGTCCCQLSRVNSFCAA